MTAEAVAVADAGDAIVQAAPPVSAGGFDIPPQIVDSGDADVIGAPPQPPQLWIPSGATPEPSVDTARREREAEERRRRELAEVLAAVLDPAAVAAAMAGVMRSAVPPIAAPVLEAPAGPDPVMLRRMRQRADDEAILLLMD